jgi:hypothetical protein
MPSLDAAYDIREEFREADSASSGLGEYALSWQSRVLAPLVMAYGIAKRKPWLVVFGFSGQVLVYSLSGLRSVLLSILMLFAAIQAYGKSGKSLGLRLAIGILSLVAISVVVDLSRDSIDLTSLFVRRLMLTPGLLMGQYLEFFDSNPFIQLSNSILAPWNDYPYDKSYTFEIGQFVTGASGANLNAGIWPDAYAQFGLTGILVFSALVGLYFWLLNSLAKERDRRVIAALSAIVGWSLVNSPLQTSLVTHGLLLLAVCVFLMPREKSANSDAGDQT